MLPYKYIFYLVFKEYYDYRYLAEFIKYYSKDFTNILNFNIYSTRLINTFLQRKIILTYLF